LKTAKGGAREVKESRPSAVEKKNLQEQNELGDWERLERSPPDCRFGPHAVREGMSSLKKRKISDPRKATGGDRRNKKEEGTAGRQEGEQAGPRDLSRKVKGSTI